MLFIILICIRVLHLFMFWHTSIHIIPLSIVKRVIMNLKFDYEEQFKYKKKNQNLN